MIPAPREYEGATVCCVHGSVQFRRAFVSLFTRYLAIYRFAPLHRMSTGLFFSCNPIGRLLLLVVPRGFAISRPM